MNTTEQRFTKHVSVPSDEGIRVDKAITIQRPVAEVYSFWRRFENLARFMRHVESVRESDPLHSHWVVKTVGGKTVEWDAEIIEQRENEMISWRSTPEADVDNAGSVWFTPLPGGRATMLRVELKYSPPAGKAGAIVAKIFRRDAATEIGGDLARLKTFLETGELPQENTMSEFGRRANEAVRKGAKAVDHCVHEYTWAAIGTTVICGFVVGFLLGQQSSRAMTRTERR